MYSAKSIHPAQFAVNISILSPLGQPFQKQKGQTFSNTATQAVLLGRLSLSMHVDMSSNTQMVNKPEIGMEPPKARTAMSCKARP